MQNAQKARVDTSKATSRAALMQLVMQLDDEQSAGAESGRSSRLGMYIFVGATTIACAERPYFSTLFFQTPLF